MNLGAAIGADVFAPSARLTADDITEATTASGVTVATFTVEFSHPSGIGSLPSPGNSAELIVRRAWGPTDELPVTRTSTTPTTNGILATYELTAPGGTWDPLDYGDYVISTVAGTVVSTSGRPIQSREIGSFNVRIENESVIIVDQFADQPGSMSLRDAIIAANASPQLRTIILDTGTYTIDIPHVADANSTFPNPADNLFCDAPNHTTGWSNETTGDFDITGNVVIIGNQNDLTVIDARGFDRVFKVHPGANLSLQRLTVTGGVSPPDQGGGGILSAGTVALYQTNVRNNRAVPLAGDAPIRGGGIAAWDGRVDLWETWVTGNESVYGGGLFFCEAADGTIYRSTIDNNTGGGLHSHSSKDMTIDNSTFSANEGGRGAIFNGSKDGFDYANAASWSPSISDDGRFVAFSSDANNLVPGDNNGLRDIFVHDRLTGDFERINIGNNGEEPFYDSFDPVISGNGNVVVFQSQDSEMVPVNNNIPKIFVYRRDTGTLSLASVDNFGVPANNNSYAPAVSDDGTVVSFWSRADNLDVSVQDTNNGYDLFTHNLVTGVTQRVTYKTGGGQAEASDFFLSQKHGISADGRYLAYSSSSTDLVADDFNGLADIFIVDTVEQTTDRIVVHKPTGGVEEPSGYSLAPSISADGRYVVFDSPADNFVSEDKNFRADIFLYDRLAEPKNRLTRISETADGTESNRDSFDPTIHADGKLVAFITRATSLDPTDNDTKLDVFLKNWQTGELVARQPRRKLFQRRPGRILFTNDCRKRTERHFCLRCSRAHHGRHGPQIRHFYPRPQLRCHHIDHCHASPLADKRRESHHRAHDKFGLRSRGRCQPDGCVTCRKRCQERLGLPCCHRELAEFSQCRCGSNRTADALPTNSADSPATGRKSCD